MANILLALLHCFCNPSKKGCVFAFPHLVSSHMKRPGQLSVQMTKSRNCLSPPCTANDKKINTGNGQPQLPAIRSPSHTRTNTHCAADYIMLCICTVKAAAVAWLAERERERETWSSSFTVWSNAWAAKGSSSMCKAGSNRKRWS